MTLYVLNFNNYYNRVIKKFDNMDDYDPYVITFFEGISFNPNDQIQTEQILNYSYDMNPDYLIVCDEEDNIVSRWFITEAVRTRSLQYKISLLRDVIVDWYDDIANAPCYIEKATLGVNNPLIFNNEEMTFNQIKTKETLITDRSKMPWYAIYVRNDYSDTIELADVESVTPNITVSSLSQYQYNDYVNTNYIAPPDTTKLEILISEPRALDLGYKGWYIGIDTKNNQLIKPDSGVNTIYDGLHKVKGWFDDREGYIIQRESSLESSVDDGLIKSFQQAVKDLDLKSGIPSIVTYDTDDIFSQDGQIILDQSTQTFYTIKVVKQEDNLKKVTTIPVGSSLFNTIDNAIMAPAEAVKFWQEIYSTPSNDIFERVGDSLFYATTHAQYKIIYEPMTLNKFKLDISAGREHTADQPYDVILVPAGSIRYTLTYNDQYLIRFSNENFADRLITALLNRENANTNIFDIQKLPYCPFNDDLFSVFSDTIAMNLNAANSGMKLGLTYAIAGNINEAESLYDIYGLIFYANSSSFRKRLTDSKYKISMPVDAVEVKVMNECDTYRIVSPNYNGQFEFSVAKNNGLEGFDIAVSMIPYTPYIKVAPIFNGLYGQSYNDARGMICAGDFSIARTSSEWIEYKRTNKTYQEMFNRQIENMEVNNSVQRIMERVNAATGTLSGGASGAMTGALVGGGYGAAAGAIVGGVASGAGGVADLLFNEKLRTEAIDYTKDQFGFQLRNIQAIPYNLTKVSTITADNKIFPFLEYYTCTDEEKQALREKIKYNGMTVGVISTINNFINVEPSYIKGKLIRSETIKEDSHVLNAIANELNQGVFI